MSAHPHEPVDDVEVRRQEAREHAQQETPVTAPGRHTGPLRVGVGGPVGAGKTALIYRLCRALAPAVRIGVVTNDIYTREDAAFLAAHSALAPERVIGMETGGCPHAAIRDDVSGNLEAIDELLRATPDLQLIFVESGGDNLAATFSPDLVERDIYVIDVAAGDKIPRKRGRGLTQADLLLINKIDLAPYVGADLEVMARDARTVRRERPTIFTDLQSGIGLPEVAAVVASWLPASPEPSESTAQQRAVDPLPRWSTLAR